MTSRITYTTAEALRSVLVTSGVYEMEDNDVSPSVDDHISQHTDQSDSDSAHVQ